MHLNKGVAIYLVVTEYSDTDTEGSAFHCCHKRCQFKYQSKSFFSDSP